MLIFCPGRTVLGSAIWLLASKRPPKVIPNLAAMRDSVSPGSTSYCVTGISYISLRFECRPFPINSVAVLFASNPSDCLLGHQIFDDLFASRRCNFHNHGRLATALAAATLFDQPVEDRKESIFPPKLIQVACLFYKVLCRIFQFTDRNGLFGGLRLIDHAVQFYQSLD